MVHYTCEIPGLCRALEPCVEKLNPDLMSESFLWIASCADCLAGYISILLNMTGQGTKMLLLNFIWFGLMQKRSCIIFKYKTISLCLVFIC